MKTPDFGQYWNPSTRLCDSYRHVNGESYRNATTLVLCSYYWRCCMAMSMAMLVAMFMAMFVAMGGDLQVAGDVCGHVGGDVADVSTVMLKTDDLWQ